MSSSTAVAITSLTSATVTYSDGSTRAFGPNPILDLIANKTVPIQMLHSALTAFHTSQVATAKQAGSDAANAAIEPTHTQLAALLANGTPADLAAAKAVLATAMLPAKQKTIAALQAKAAAVQAELVAAQA